MTTSNITHCRICGIKIEVNFWDLCDQCTKTIEYDMFLNDLKTAATTALYECPGALPHIQRAIKAAETE